MNYRHKKIIGYGLLAVGVVMAPLLPFWYLLFVPLFMMWCGLPVAALLFSIALDSFLVPGGVTPIWASLTFYSVLFVPICVYVRYTTIL